MAMFGTEKQDWCATVSCPSNAFKCCVAEDLTFNVAAT